MRIAGNQRRNEHIAAMSCKNPDFSAVGLGIIWL
jgi:hypothetical protein